MSRIGKMPVTVPDKVKVNISGQDVNVEGPKGKLSISAHPMMKVSTDDGKITVERPDDSREAKSLHGLTRSLINNLVIGVSAGYERRLLIQGVGYRAETKGRTLTLNLGFSHKVVFDLPEGIDVKVEDKTKLLLTGIDKQLVGATAAKIRSYRPPEPYGGKGIRYSDEYVRRKEGKSGAK